MLEAPGLSKIVKMRHALELPLGAVARDSVTNWCLVKTAGSLDCYGIGRSALGGQKLAGAAGNIIRLWTQVLGSHCRVTLYRCFAPQNPLND